MQCFEVGSMCWTALVLKLHCSFEATKLATKIFVFKPKKEDMSQIFKGFRQWRDFTEHQQRLLKVG
jgi:hypothetical protein